MVKPVALISPSSRRSPRQSTPCAMSQSRYSAASLPAVASTAAGYPSKARLYA